jgi:hypothetical protein
MKTKVKDLKRPNFLVTGNSLSNQEIFTASLKRWWQNLGYYSMFTALPAIFASLSAQEARAEEDSDKPEMRPSAGREGSLLEKLNKRYSKPELLRRQSSFLAPPQKNNIISAFAGSDDCPGAPIPGGTYTAAAPYTDSGSTAGANNTVNRLIGYYYYSYDTPGADQIYSFTITGLGPNPQIRVSAASPAYKPMTYILYGRFGGGCPAGTGQTMSNLFSAGYSPTPGGVATIGGEMQYLPFNEPLHLFVDSDSATAANNSGPYTLRIQDLYIAPVKPPRAKSDYDGDGKADVSVFRPSNGTWHLNRSTLGNSAATFGLSTDEIIPADFDGDNRIERAVFRNEGGVGVWLIYFNQHWTWRKVFGLGTDTPVRGDFDGDGAADFAIYRPSTASWVVQKSNSNAILISRPFGISEDIPLAADWDGDGKDDITIFRPSNAVWAWVRSSDGRIDSVPFGANGDTPIVGDFDGDKKTDLAIYRPSTSVWFIQKSNNTGFIGVAFGASGDIPVAADYDGDGKTDIAVFRPSSGVWSIFRSLDGLIEYKTFGASGDIPTTVR